MFVFDRMGVGKQTLEMKVIEEISYLNEAIREKKGKTFDPSVSEIVILLRILFLSPLFRVFKVWKPQL